MIERRVQQRGLSEVGPRKVASYETQFSLIKFAHIGANEPAVCKRLIQDVKLRMRKVALDCVGPHVGMGQICVNETTLGQRYENKLSHHVRDAVRKIDALKTVLLNGLREKESAQIEQTYPVDLYLRGFDLISAPGRQLRVNALQLCARPAGPQFRFD
jgi:hypothetical protein